MIPISICVIMKNEEAFLDGFLSSVNNAFRSYPHEIVIVDTGSVDSSIDIARKHGIEPYLSEWKNDFSYSRNLAADFAVNDLIICLDCDEYIVEADPAKLVELLSSLNTVGTLTIHNHFNGSNGDEIYTTNLARVYNRTFCHFKGSIHEQIVSIDGSPISSIKVPLSVEHFGYAGSDEKINDKTERNINLLKAELSKHPDDPYILYHLGQCHNMLHDDKNAAAYYEKALSLNSDISLEYVRMMITTYGYNLLHLERYDEVLKLTEKHDISEYDPDFSNVCGLAYMRTCRYLEAMQCFLKAASFTNAYSMGSNTYIPLYNMGLINEMLGNTEGALTLYRQCGDFKPAIERLEDLSK